jgi:clan AA aspartic protease
VPISIAGPDQQFIELEAMVDTGATNTVLPADVLRRLKVEPHARFTFQLGDGREVEMDVGRAWVRVDGQQELTQVVFGEAGAAPLLGAVTLEEMALAVDPLAQRLVPVTKYLL